MREIKFRAWDNNSKSYYFKDYDPDYSKRQLSVAHIDCYSDYDRDTFVFEQYTGLKDKNGKEIYEGDVVKSQTGRICKIVYFSSPSFCGWDLIALNCGGRPPLDRMWEGWEVIGNIHENTELLEKLVMREL